MGNKRSKKKPEDTVYTLGITCYDEHIPGGKDNLFKAIKSAHSDDHQIIAIWHYKTQGKPHYHIAIRMTNSDDREKASYFLSLLGIVFRPGLDDNFLKHKALETCGSYSSYVTYLMHKTIDAIQLGKAEYDESDLITNLTPSELQEVLSGYNIKKKKLSNEGLSNIIDKARTAGYNLESYNNFIDSFHILGLTYSAENKIKKSYETGIRERMVHNPVLNRLVVEIEYPKGANSADKELLINTVRNVLSDSNYDYSYGKDQTSSNDLMISPFTDAIILTTAYAHLSEKAVQLSSATITEYRPSSSNKKTIWCGKYMFLLHDYIDQTKHNNGKRSCKILQNSLFCEIIDNKLKCTGFPTKSYSTQERDFITSEFRNFRERFNLAMQQTQKPEYGSLSLDILNS